jgi:uncharacterized protein (DUF885 family)
MTVERRIGLAVEERVKSDKMLQFLLAQLDPETHKDTFAKEKQILQELNTDGVVVEAGYFRDRPLSLRNWVEYLEAVQALHKKTDLFRKNGIEKIELHANAAHYREVREKTLKLEITENGFKLVSSDELKQRMHDTVTEFATVEEAKKWLERLQKSVKYVDSDLRHLRTPMALENLKRAVETLEKKELAEKVKGFWIDIDRASHYDLESKWFYFNPWDKPEELKKGLDSISR